MKPDLWLHPDGKTVSFTPPMFPHGWRQLYVVPPAEADLKVWANEEVLTKLVHDLYCNSREQWGCACTGPATGHIECPCKEMYTEYTKAIRDTLASYLEPK